MARELKPCGTYAAYHRHLRNREIPCEACYAAHASRERELRARRGYVRGPYARPGCGSYAGYQAHQRRGEVACEPCLEAARNYRRELRARRATAAAAA